MDVAQQIKEAITSLIPRAASLSKEKIPSNIYMTPVSKKHQQEAESLESLTNELLEEFRNRIMQSAAAFRSNGRVPIDFARAALFLDQAVPIFARQVDFLFEHLLRVRKRLQLQEAEEEKRRRAAMGEPEPEPQPSTSEGPARTAEQPRTREVAAPPQPQPQPPPQPRRVEPGELSRMAQPVVLLRRLEDAPAELSRTVEEERKPIPQRILNGASTSGMPQPSTRDLIANVEVKQEPVDAIKDEPDDSTHGSDCEMVPSSSEVTPKPIFDRFARVPMRFEVLSLDDEGNVASVTTVEQLVPVKKEPKAEPVSGFPGYAADILDPLNKELARMKEVWARYFNRHNGFGGGDLAEKARQLCPQRVTITVERLPLRVMKECLDAIRRRKKRRRTSGNDGESDDGTEGTPRKRTRRRSSDCLKSVMADMRSFETFYECHFPSDVRKEHHIIPYTRDHNDNESDPFFDTTDLEPAIANSTEIANSIEENLIDSTNNLTNSEQRTDTTENPTEPTRNLNTIDLTDVPSDTENHDSIFVDLTEDPMTAEQRRDLYLNRELDETERSEMQGRCGIWENHMDKRIEKRESESFNIHQYQGKIMGKLSEVKKKMLFERLVTILKGRGEDVEAKTEEWWSQEMARNFAAVLHLVNDERVVMTEWEDGEVAYGMRVGLTGGDEPEEDCPPRKRLKLGG